MKPRIRKVDGQWQVARPGYGFSPATVDRFDSWREAAESLRTAPASAGPSSERGYYSLGLNTERGSYHRGTIRLEGT